MLGKPLMVPGMLVFFFFPFAVRALHLPSFEAIFVTVLLQLRLHRSELLYLANSQMATPSFADFFSPSPFILGPSLVAVQI